MILKGKILLQNGVVTDTAEHGICFAKTPSYSSLNARIALIIMGKATRLFVLQNKEISQIVSNSLKLEHDGDEIILLH